MFRISLILILVSSLQCFSQNKLALVVGNGNYDFMTIPFALNNGSDLSEKLESLGFEVMDYYDLDLPGLKSAIDKFGQNLSGYEVGLFYYSGLALQVKGENWLIPVDENPQTDNDVEYGSLNVGRILGKMEDAGTTANIIIFDASINNPVERSWTESDYGHGMAFMDAPAGSIIAYSTSPGRTVVKTDERNSLYTKHLLMNIEQPNISIEDIFKKIRSDVREESENRQIPWESTSFEGNFYFAFDEEFTGLILTNVTSEDNTDLSKDRDISSIFTDERDGQNYRWVEIGDQVWMAENINYRVEDKSWCYDNLERNCEIYGRLYNYEGAMESCPDGWHIPSDEEWKILEINLGMSRTEADKRAFYRGTIEGGRLKSKGSDTWERPNNGATDDVGFNALPGGWRDGTGVFDQLGKWGFFWSYSQHTNMCAWSRVLFFDDPRIERMNLMNIWGQSVRCIKD